MKNIITQFEGKVKYEVKYLPTWELKKPEYRKKQSRFGSMKWLKLSLQKNGVITPVIINKRINGDLIIINGYNVNKMWRALGNKEILSIVVEITIQQEQELHIYINKLGQENDLASILNYLEELNPLDFGLIGTNNIGTNNSDKKDDSNHLEKEKLKAKARALENAKKGIDRWRLTYKVVTLRELKKRVAIIGNELGFKKDHQVIEYLIINYKK